MTEPFDSAILALLERRYKPGAEQRCRVCGGEMRFVGRTEFGNDRFFCAVIVPPERMITPGGFKDRVDHYLQSELVIAGKPDREVVALIEAYRELASQKAGEGS